MAVGTYVIISTIGDGVNSLRVQMAAPLPAAQSPAGWADSETLQVLQLHQIFMLAVTMFPRVLIIRLCRLSVIRGSR
ncbi:hypothetical protein CCP3SC1AL1_1590017 [Gammaproteobacteria bacterium]